MYVIISGNLLCKLLLGYHTAIHDTDSSGVAFLGVFVPAYRKRKKTFEDTTQRWQRLRPQNSPQIKAALHSLWIQPLVSRGLNKDLEHLCSAALKFLFTAASR